MKQFDRINLLFIFLIFISLYFILNTNYTNPFNKNPYTTQPESAITFPKSGDKLVEGKNYILRWKATPGTTDIFLINHAYESEGVSISIADRIYDVPNIGIFTYKVPTNIPAGEYKFTIGNLNSEYFDIEK